MIHRQLKRKRAITPDLTICAVSWEIRRYGSTSVAKDLKNEAMGRTEQIEDIKRANGTVFIVAETGRPVPPAIAGLVRGKNVVARLLSTCVLAGSCVRPRLAFACACYDR